MEDLLKHRLLDPPPRVSNSQVWGGDQEFAFLTFPGDADAGEHGENYCFKQNLQYVQKYRHENLVHLEYLSKFQYEDVRNKAGEIGIDR